MLANLKPVPRLTVSEWADTHRKLSPEASSEPGQWTTARAEYQREILDAISDPDTHTVVVMCSAQVGKTEMLLNAVGYFIHQDPSPILLIQPNQEPMAETFSKDRLAPMLRDTPCLQGLVSEPKSRDSANTILHKQFPGGHITIAGANSEASLASRPIRIVLCDEVDKYPAAVGKSGDPVSMAKMRSTTFWNRKLALTSTPSLKGYSRIDDAYTESDMRRYFVPCHKCGLFQVLDWARVKWDDGKPETARYECECGSTWNDGQRWKAVRHGKWEAEKPFTGVAGFHFRVFIPRGSGWPKSRARSWTLNTRARTSGCSNS